MIGLDRIRGAIGAAGRVLQVERVHQVLAEAERRASAGEEAAEPVGTVRQELVVLGMHLAGAGLATAGVVTRTARLPATVPMLAGVAANVPQLREALRGRLGAARAEQVLALGESTLGAAAGHPIGLLVNAVHGAQRVSEARAREQVLARRGRELLSSGTAPALPPGRSDGSAGEIEVGPGEPLRPVPLPAGPVERYAGQVTAAGAAGLLGGLLSARPELRLAAIAGASAKPARLTKEAWASRVGALAARHDVVVLDSRVFRRLDRVDTVVIEAGLLASGRWAVDEVVPLTETADPAECYARATELLAEGEPPRGGDGWQVRSRRGGSAEHRQLAQRLPAGGRVLTLHRGDEPVALVAAAPELDPYAEAVVAAGNRVGQIWIAGVGSQLDLRLGVAGAVPGGSQLTAQLRKLQQAGHGVVLVARHGTGALNAADCGIGVAAAGQSPARPAGHLVAGPGLAEAVVVLGAVPAARRAARVGVMTAGYGAAAGALVGLTGLGGPGGAARNATIATNLAALAGIAAGAWYAEPVIHGRRPHPVDRSPWHAVPVPDVLRRLGSSMRGLSEQEADRRHRADEEDEPTPENLGRATVHELDNPLTPALTAGAGLAAASGSTLDAALIGVVLGINALVGGVQRWGAGRAVRRLAERTTVPLRIRRDNHELRVTNADLVQGDIVELRAGDAVPADARVVQADGLELDEASLTGESLPVLKSPEPSVARQLGDRTSMVYEGTAVAAGKALVTVVAAGDETESQRATAGADTDKSGGVQARLAELTRSSLPLSVGGGAALLAANLLRGRTAREAVTPAVSLAVAAVPEGLPSVATVAQLSAANRLSRRGVLVRNPAALESLGRVQTLCFDKTGTLTEGRLRLRAVSDGDQRGGPDGLSPRLRGVLAAALRASPHGQAGRRLPHPTDQAVVTGAREAGVSTDEGTPGWRRGEELPFEPARSFHAGLGRTDDGDLLSVKGAPEVVLERCTSRLVDEGATERLTAAARRRLTRAADELAGRGHRVLAVAEGPAPADVSLENLGELRFVGFVTLADRARDTAAAAVRTLRHAGVRVVMVTGDHPGTAEAVASELDLMNGGTVMTGGEIDRRTDEELTDLLPSVSVFARVDPSHKVRIVRLLRAAGEVVAVTGDGANDAPAIRSADVGIALGSRATPAARQAADVVVTDNRIETVVDAVVEGRILWSSVREAVAVLLGGNLGEIGFTVGAGVVGATTLRPRQLLLVNMLTDVVPAMALAARQPPGITEEGLLAAGPELSLGEALQRDIRIRATATAGAAAAAWLAARLTGTPTRATTVALIALVAAQLGQTLAAGRRDPVVVAACGLSLAALVAAVQLPGLSQLLGCRPVGPVGWTIGLTAAAGSSALATVAMRPTPAGPDGDGPVGASPAESSPDGDGPAGAGVAESSPDDTSPAGASPAGASPASSARPSGPARGSGADANGATRTNGGAGSGGA